MDASAPPDSSASMFDALPKAARQLLLVSAERAITITGEALLGLMAGPTLAPSAAAEWHEKVLTEAARSLFKAWETIEPTDRYLAGAYAIMALLSQQLRQGATGISLLRQNGQLPPLPAGESPSPAPPGESASPAPGSSTQEERERP